jgi:thiopeptide-type bacteriocin biosynthesis protein
MALSPFPTVNANSPRKYIPAPFFALRTPLLPFDALGQLSELRRWVEDATIREALFVASSSLEESIPAWLETPHSEWGQRVEHALVRYLSRMAGRATPFGLFASHGLGRWGTTSQLRVGGRNTLRKHTRIDMDYVWTLVEKVRAQPEVRRALRYVPNSSLHATQAQYRYIEAREREGRRSYGLVAVSRNPFLDTVIERARGGATLDELTQALMAVDSDITEEDARPFVESLVDSWVLVSDWAPTLTGAEPLVSLISQARQIPALAEVARRLEDVQRMLTDMDASPPGIALESYRKVRRALEDVVPTKEAKHLFQVDTFRPPQGVTLSRRVLDEVQRGTEALRRISPMNPEDPLKRFRERFAERYEERSVPLLEALDDECGIGFQAETRPGATTGALLQGFAFPARGARSDRIRVEKRVFHLLRRLEEVNRKGLQELVLTDDDLKAMEAETSTVLPDSYAVMGTLVAPSAEAVDQGQFRFHIEAVQGASSATLMGRFCHGDPELTELVREQLRAEEAQRPHAIYAEIVHLPDDRMGNIICRPALRGHDIVFLGKSGLGASEQIEASDLWLSLERGRLVLRSHRLGKEIIPRLASAHNFWMYGLNVYRFLCMLQSQGTQDLAFKWGILESAAFLPRLTYGRTVLALACWNVGRKRLEEWGKLSGTERFEAVQRFRQESRLPRWVVLKDGDNQLPIDMDSQQSVEVLVELVRRRGLATLEEVYPGPHELCVEGEDGRYHHEVVIPFVRERPEKPAPAPRPVKLPPPTDRRRFPPGSEWLYLKLYAGSATVDRVLRTALAEPIRQVMSSGAADRWFFIRYRDPEFHLRLRFHGEPQRLMNEVWPTLRDACSTILEEGNGWRLQLDTYEREVERYGGPVGIELSEELFMADSEAALAIVEAYSGDRGADLRWRVALKGMDMLLGDLGLSLPERATVAKLAREGYAQEFGIERSERFKDQLSDRFRRERKGLEALLAAKQITGGALQPGFAALSRRSAQVAEVGRKLRQAQQDGQLTVPLEGLAQSFLHMQAIRMLPDEQRPQELLLHDFLTRLYRSFQARGKA